MTLRDDGLSDAGELVRIGDLLERTAGLFADRPAIQCGADTRSYSQLSESVRKTREDLRRLGVAAGDRLLIVSANSIEAVVLLFAGSALGAWPVVVSDRIAPAQLDRIVDHCDPCLSLFVSSNRGAEPQHARKHQAQPISWTAMTDVWSSRRDPKPVAEARADRPQDDVAAMIYTSGTTGEPKGAMLSHRNLLFTGLTQMQLRHYSETDKTYCPLPLAHVGALTILMCVIAAGACMYLASRFVPAELAAAIRNDGVTVIPGLPPLHVKFMEWVADHPDRLERGRVRLVTTSSSPLHAPVKRAVEEMYGCPLQNGYGQTEAGMVFQVETDAWREDTSVGHALPGMRVRIADPDGNSLPAGEIGEILVRGPSVFLGYYRDPEATRAAFTSDGWLRTGDLAYLDETQAAFVTGRSAETIRRSGYSIFPAEIEGALNEHPGVAQSAVVAGTRVADEEVVAFVQPKKDASVAADEILDFLKERIAAYELPGDLRLVERMPTLTNGKIDKRKLREWARGAPSRRRPV